MEPSTETPLTPRRRYPSRGTIFRAISITVVTLIVLFLLLGIWVYRQSVGRFEVRRLSLPTRIYADYTPLTPGTPIGRDDLLEKLDRLGYRESDNPSQAGEFSAGKSDVSIFTRAFTHPSGTHPSELVTVTFHGSTIDSVDADGAALEPELLTSILSERLENRRPAQLEQIPKHLQDAVIVTEDIRFWHHPGVDPLGIFRAAIKNLRSHGVAEGGSTLTQQLVKNYYLTGERTLRRKLVEAFMALILDAKYSKREILEAYLNDIYLGRNRSISIIGVGEASRFYFGKPVSEINEGEAALLAGMIRSPNNYSPFANPEKARERRNTVLGLMLRNRKIDRATYDKMIAAPLPKKPFRQKTGLTSIPYYVDRVLDEMATDYDIKDVKGRGLQIYTAIDLGAQDTAARTLESGLRGLEKSSRRLRRRNIPLQGALIHVDIPTGEIRALVGGRNYEVSQFNRATKAKRQVGSLFKPYVYLTAFEPSLSGQNITPATIVSDTRFILKRRFSADWSPRNYEDRYMGPVTVRTALEQSLNSASVRIGLACGLSAVLRTAKTLGIETDLPEQPAILLGAVDVPPIEMAESYSTIARMGARMPLRTIRYVTNDRGSVVSSGGDVEPVQVFPARDVFLLNYVMRGVLDRGTARVTRRMGFKKIAAGKTGTTNDKRDAWFIGYTPKTLALTWVGFDDNAPIGVAGGEGAAPIWTRYMSAVTSGAPNVDFATPPGIVFAMVDRLSGGAITEYCPPDVAFNEAFKAGTQSMTPCQLHTPQVPLYPMYDQFGNLITDTMYPTTTDMALPPLPDSTLTGGFTLPPPATATAPPTTTTPTTTTTTTTAPPSQQQPRQPQPPSSQPAPQPTTPPPPPPTETRSPPSMQPAPSTNTSSPPASTTTT